MSSGGCESILNLKSGCSIRGIFLRVGRFLLGTFSQNFKMFCLRHLHIHIHFHFQYSLPFSLSFSIFTFIFNFKVDAGLQRNIDLNSESKFSCSRSSFLSSLREPSKPTKPMKLLFYPLVGFKGPSKPFSKERTFRVNISKHDNSGKNRK